MTEHTLLTPFGLLNWHMQPSTSKGVTVTLFINFNSVYSSQVALYFLLSTSKQTRGGCRLAIIIIFSCLAYLPFSVATQRTEIRSAVYKQFCIASVGGSGDQEGYLGTSTHGCVSSRLASD